MADNQLSSEKSHALSQKDSSSTIVLRDLWSQGVKIAERVQKFESCAFFEKAVTVLVYSDERRGSRRSRGVSSMRGGDRYLG